MYRRVHTQIYRMPKKKSLNVTKHKYNKVVKIGKMRYFFQIKERKTQESTLKTFGSGALPGLMLNLGSLKMI